jgi:hypothetical protein
MATKKIKRFQEGGMSDKDRGLEASKEDKVGFFERLRMGNIDEEGSEAYRRFGAGRGKAERTPEEDRAATPVVRETAKLESPAAARLMAAGMAAGERQPSGDASMAEMYSGPRTKPIVADQPKPGGRKNVDVQASKPSAPAKSAPAKTSAYPMTGAQPTTKTYERKGGATADAKTSAYPMKGAQPTTKTYERSGGPTADELANYKPSAKNQSLASQIPGGSSTGQVSGKKVEPMSDTERNIQNMLAVTGVGAGAAGALYKGKKMLDARKAAKEGARKRANLRRDAEEGIDRNLADEFQNYSPSDAKKAIAAKQRLAKTKAERSRDLSAGQAKTKFTSASKTPSKKTKKFDDSESNVEFKRGGSISGASRRADGIATKGKTRCKMR